MPPRNFCDIDSKYYFFGKSDTPEEKVRQWMIFELLAVYNVPVQAISIEAPVKVGTRSHYNLYLKRLVRQIADDKKLLVGGHCSPYSLLYLLSEVRAVIPISFSKATQASD
jgi:hypothetical protein